MYLVGSRVVDLLGKRKVRRRQRGPKWNQTAELQLSGDFLEEQVVSQLVSYESCPFFRWYFWLSSGFVPCAVCFEGRQCETSGCHLWLTASVCSLAMVRAAVVSCRLSGWWWDMPCGLTLRVGTFYSCWGGWRRLEMRASSPTFCLC